MDCYSGMSFEELIVPSYQESSSETYPFNGMWGGWSMNSTGVAEKIYDYDGSKAFYGGSSLHDFEGIEQMDDIFLSSILEEVPGNDEDLHCSSSSYNSVGSSSMNGCKEGSMFHCHVMPLKGEAPFTISDLSEQSILDSNYRDELSSEQLVLQDLQRVSEKLTDETRKCFRDTFYRLARNSEEKSDSVNTYSEEFLVQASRFDNGNGTRLSRDGEIESETNSIDRAIANLIFNKMESNISRFPIPERVQ